MSDHIKDMQKQMADNVKAADAIYKAFEGKEAEMPQEEADKIAAFLGQNDELKTRLSMASRLRADRDLLNEPAGAQTIDLTDWRKAAPGEGDVPVDGHAWREIEIKTNGGDLRTFRYNVPAAVEAKGYGNAYESYLRKGIHEMGPTDRKTLSEGVDSAGGFLVPPDYQADLIKKIATIAVVRQNAMVAQTSRDVAQWPKVQYTADDEYTSGVRLTWSGAENPASTSHRVTDPVFGMYNIPVHTAMASMPLSLNLLEDSAFDVLGIASELLGEAFGLGEDDAFWNGSGAARPRGIITAAEGSSGNADFIERGATGVTADSIAGDELIDLVFALPAQYERNAKLYMNKATEKAVRKLTSTDGNYLWPVWPQVGNLGVSPREILGFPVVRDEFLPDIASSADTFPIIFADLMGYLVLDRVGLSIQRVSEPYVEQNYMVLLGRKRVGGQVIQPWRMRSYFTDAST
jgi:HK97 family phage major capsid protein